MTFTLISSSGTMAMAVNYAYRRDRRKTTLLMLTTAGRCYSIGELQDMPENIGFVDVQYVPTDVYRSLIIARKGA